MTDGGYKTSKKFLFLKQISSRFIVLIYERKKFRRSLASKLFEIIPKKNAKIEKAYTFTVIEYKNEYN